MADPAELIELAWEALQKEPRNIENDACAWLMSRANRDALIVHKYEGPGSNPVSHPSIRDPHLRLFGIRVISGQDFTEDVLLLAKDVCNRG